MSEPTPHEPDVHCTPTAHRFTVAPDEVCLGEWVCVCGHVHLFALPAHCTVVIDVADLARQAMPKLFPVVEPTDE